MLSEKESMLTQNRHRLTRSLVFFAGFYLFVLWVVEPSLVYHSFGTTLPYPVFYGGWEFLKGYLVYPGGPVEYGGAFLSQWYYYSWLGALIFTAILWGICRGFGCYMSGAGIGRAGFISFLPGVALMMMQSRYINPLCFSLALLACLWASVMYVKI